MSENIQLPPLRNESLFSVPVWRSRVPALFAEHEAMKQDILQAHEQGAYERHKHGYGYQSPATIFYDESIARYPYFATLKQAFIQTVEGILRQRGGLATSMPFRISAVLGWVLVQTDEEWVSGTWHDHYPATISGCYYLQVPETATPEEGALAFQRPSPQDMFVEHVQRIKPTEGEFILFPSSLYHRPEPCPSAGDTLRISINMDAYVDWLHKYPEGGEEIPGARFREMLKESLE